MQPAAVPGYQDHVLRPFPIREALQDRVMAKGEKSLSDAELLGVLIKSGDARMSAVDVAYNVLHRVDKDLHQLALLSPMDLAALPGMGRSKAVAILAALELGRRRHSIGVEQRPLVSTSATAYELLKAVLADTPHEEFYTLLLDRGNRLIHRERISVGGLHGTVADPKLIFRSALERRASSLILAHNHPSGQLRPSTEDIALTRKLVEGGRFLEITVQDHLIVTQAGYYSFADNGQLN